MVHTGGLHRLNLRACGLGLVKDHPIKQLTTKRERKGAAAEQDGNSYKGAHPGALDTGSFAALTHRENSTFIFNDSSETFVDSSERYGHPHCTTDNFGAGKYNDMPSLAAHRLLEKRDNDTV